MEGICFGCNQRNEKDQAFCGACGAPLVLSSYIAKEVTSRVSESTREREVIETESAIRIFERSWGWAKLVGGIATGFAALLIAGAAWLTLDLRSTVKIARNEVETTKGAAEKSINDTATVTRNEIESKATMSLEDIQGAAKRTAKSSSDAQATVKAQSVAITTQAGGLRRDFQAQASAVTNDVASARQQIQEASKLQPQLTALQQQLASAQAQIKEQQNVITSSEDFAKKIFSSHKQLVFDLKIVDKSQYAVIDAGKNSDGIELVLFFLIIPNAPVEGTLEPQFNQTVVAPNSFFNLHNLVLVFIQKPSQQELLGKPISIRYFPDTSDKNLVKTLAVKNGKVIADGIALPFGGPATPPSRTPVLPQAPPK